MNRIILTGASGFLGRNLLERFSEPEKYRVIALTSQPDRMAQLGFAPHISFRPRSFLFDADRAGPEIEGAILINCAYPRNTDGVSIASGLKYISDVFRVARERGARAVINISSQSVYSQKRMEPADENTELNLESVYATGKYATELLLNEICRDIPHTNLRMSSLIGAGFNQRITNKMIDRVLASGRLHVTLNARRFGFMDVRDAARAIVALVETAPERWRETYCVGTGQAWSLLEIAECVAKLSGELLGLNPEILTECAEEQGNSAVTGTRLKEDTGFVSTYTLEDSMRAIFLEKRAEQNRSGWHMEGILQDNI
ncbi:MAG: NAD(P)-dependent oxidoreductase [Oscillospiraceae bacterium]|nr:NAD(P)-dependent oxidoreductase [Oscillospiraceae bacterium]